MFIQYNQLRSSRKKSSLMQTDMAFLLQLPDASAISRWENGDALPDIKILLVYNLLFDTSIESLFARQKQAIADIIVERIKMRIEELKTRPTDLYIDNRIAFLTGALTRLTADKTV